MIHKTPLVSISVVTYNHYNYIKQCLDGILMQQTTFPFEIILGEDESTDGTREICKEYANKYPDKINLFLRSRKDVIYINGNPSGRFNMIENLKSAKGKYIALCEGDDYWTNPLKLQKQVDFLENNPEYVLCFHNVQVLNTKNKLIDYPENRVPKQHEKLENLALKGNYINTVSIVFKNIIYEYPKSLLKVPFGDFVICIILAEKGKIKYIKDKMAVYRDGVGVWGRLNDEQKIYKTAIGFVYLHTYFKNKNNTKIAIIFKNRIIDYLTQINIIDNPTILSEFLEVNNFTKEILEMKEMELNQHRTKNIDNLGIVKISKYLLNKLIKK